MAVRIAENLLSTQTSVFEARFDDGYRYLDLCGKFISQVRKHDPKWKTTAANPQSGQMVHERKEISFNINYEHLVVSRDKADVMKKTEADKLIQTLAQEASFLYQTSTDTFEIPNTVRVGARFSFVANADSLEDAEKFLVLVADSPLLDQLRRVTNSQPYSSGFRYSLEEEDTGYRRNVSIATGHVNDTDQPYTGLPGSEKPSAVVLVDIDTFTRPRSGHFAEVQKFIVSSYNRSFSQAVEILHWIGTQQKK